jgi:uncharacterized NAD(P)/FAD-binding protein YdhS
MTMTTPLHPPGPCRDDTVAIVGAGFSGTALAYRLLREPRFRGRVFLIERTGRFGPGLAYGTSSHKALLNVPAANMSLDESTPADFVDYLRGRDVDIRPNDFVPRRLFGEYLRERLEQVARASGATGRLVQVTGAATSVTRAGADPGFVVSIDDGRRLPADRVVLAVGHAPPATLPPLSRLEGSRHYVRDPWSTLPPCRPGGRVLIIGTGLSMADVVCELVDRTGAPGSIVAVSRHGLLPEVRTATLGHRGCESHDPRSIEPAPRLGTLVAAARRLARESETQGGSWRDVMAGLRLDAAKLWGGLTIDERRRFVRHVQLYWDVHRHLLPPPVGATVHAELDSGRLQVRAARLVFADPLERGARVTLRSRSDGRLETLDVDQVVVCTGPPADPTRNHSRLVRSLMQAGWLVADPSGVGLAVDELSRPLDRDGIAVDRLYYLGPWLRARDGEATAVAELRRAATVLVEAWLHEPSASATMGRRVGR